MQVRNRREPKHKFHYLFLLLAIACGMGLNLFSTLSVNRASAQSEPPADRIAFTRDGQIIVANPDGSGLADLGPGTDPTWSKQGKIAFTMGAGDTTTHIAVMDEDGANLVLLTENADTGIGEPDFSPDGSRIAYISPVLETEPGEPAPVPHARIHVMGADGQNPHPLFAGEVSSGVDQEYAPAWSPDGQKIAFIGQKTEGGSTSLDVYVANADGQSAPIRITNNLNVTYPSQLAWSPDGLRLAVAIDHDIQVVNSDGSGGLVNLTNTVVDDEFDPAWSPDGQRIAYSANYYQGEALDGIYVMDADGQNQTFLSTTGLQPTWKQREVTPEPTPTPEADVAVQLTGSPDPVRVGQDLLYTITVRNEGPDAAESVQVIFQRPADTEFVSSSAAQGSCGQNADPLKTVCQLGQIAASAQTSIQVVVRPTIVGQITASASASSTTADTDTSNNSQQLGVNVIEACATEVTGEVQQTIVRPGNQSRRNLKHTIFVRNDSGRQLNGLVHFVFDGLAESVQGDDARTTFSRTSCEPPVGRRYISVNLGNAGWSPGQTIRLDVDFFNPERVLVDYRLRIYTGPDLP